MNRSQWQPSPALWQKLKPVARQMRKAPTAAEKALWQRIRKRQVRDVKFRRQFAIGRFITDFCSSEIRLIIHHDGSISVQDNGRGIPVAKHKRGKSAMEVVFTVLHAVGKFDKDTYKVSGGLHGVGASVVNALSSYCHVEVHREGKIWKQSYEKGKPLSDLKASGVTDITGTKVTFKPDKEIFKEEV